MSPLPPRLNNEAMATIARRLGIAYETWMQDWPLEVADSRRVNDFLNSYDQEESIEGRHVLAELIAASLDEAFAEGIPSEALLDHAAAIFQNHDSIRDYWICEEAVSEEEIFSITPWMRRIQK